LPTLEVAQAIVDFHKSKQSEVHTEEQKITDEIINSDKDKIVTSVEDFSNVIKSRLKSILKNKNYERLNKLLTTDTGLNRWDSLNTLLNDAVKAKIDTEDLERNVENLLRKARAIAVGIVQTDKIIDLIYEDVKNIVSNEQEALQNITALQYHLYALKDFKIFLEEAKQTFEGSKEITAKVNDALGKIESIERYIIKNDTAGIVQAFKPYTSENIDNYLQYFKQEAQRLRKLEANSTSQDNKKAYKNSSRCS